jgi:hypothetical protein
MLGEVGVLKHSSYRFKDLSWQVISLGWLKPLAELAHYTLESICYQVSFFTRISAHFLEHKD